MQDLRILCQGLGEGRACALTCPSSGNAKVVNGGTWMTIAEVAAVIGTVVAALLIVPWRVELAARARPFQYWLDLDVFPAWGFPRFHTHRQGDWRRARSNEGHRSLPAKTQRRAPPVPLGPLWKGVSLRAGALTLQLGTGDAHTTAIAVGTVYAAWQYFVSRASMAAPRQFSAQIDPRWASRTLDCKVNLTLSLHPMALVRAIWRSLRSSSHRSRLPRKPRAGGAVRGRSPDSGSDEDGHGKH